MTLLTVEQRTDRDMSESRLKEEVLRIARSRGWRVFHLTHDPRGRSTAKGNGYPDLTCVRWNAETQKAHVVFVELKRQNEQLDEEQQSWMVALGGPATSSRDQVSHYVVRPQTLREGYVERIFK